MWHGEGQQPEPATVFPMLKMLPILMPPIRMFTCSVPSLIVPFLDPFVQFYWNSYIWTGSEKQQNNIFLPQSVPKHFFHHNLQFPVSENWKGKNQNQPYFMVHIQTVLRRNLVLVTSLQLSPQMLSPVLSLADGDIFGPGIESSLDSETFYFQRGRCDSYSKPTACGSCHQWHEHITAAVIIVWLFLLFPVRAKREGKGKGEHAIRSF